MSDYQKKVEEAPYHPGYEDAVVPPTPAYKGMDPAKMLWKSKPLSNEEIIKIFNQIWNAGGNTNGVMHRFARAIEERHGIK